MNNIEIVRVRLSVKIYKNVHKNFEKHHKNNVTTNYVYNFMKPFLIFYCLISNYSILECTLNCSLKNFKYYQITFLR